MKRTGAILTALVLSVSLAACGGEKSGDAKACEVITNLEIIRDTEPEDVPAKLTEYSFYAENVGLQRAISGMANAYTAGVASGDTSEINAYAAEAEQICSQLNQ